MTSEVLLLAGRGVRRSVRSMPLVISSLAFPLLLMFTILAVFGELVSATTRGTYIERLAPLIVLSTATFAMPGSAVGFFTDLHNGMVDRFRTMPLSALSPLAGRVAGDVLRILLVAVVAVLVAHVPGFRFSAGPVAALGFFAVIALFGMMCAWAAVWVALGGSSEEMVQGTLGPPTTLAFFLSSGFVPVTAFPAPIQPIVRANPLSVASDALAGLSRGGPVAGPLLWTLAWTAGLSAVFAVLAVRRARKFGS